MPSLSDPNYVHYQYAKASNLNARLALHARFSTNPYGWFRWVFDRLLELPSQARVLEVGCGSGGVWMANLARIPSEWEITLTDLSEGMIAEAKQSCKARARHPLRPG
jgi:methylase of polypeptide subunit release factors